MSQAKIQACIIGWPVAHSRSPLIHGYWLKKYGIDGSYVRRPVRPEEAADFFRHMREEGLAGCNVTIPHKEAAFAAAEKKSDGRARHGRRQHAVVRGRPAVRGQHGRRRLRASFARFGAKVRRWRVCRCRARRRRRGARRHPCHAGGGSAGGAHLQPHARPRRCRRSPFRLAREALRLARPCRPLARRRLADQRHLARHARHGGARHAARAACPMPASSPTWSTCRC